MKRKVLAVAAVCAALGMVTFSAGMVTLSAQAPAGGQKPASADPYASNPEAGKQKFPLAAPAGKDSGAKDTPLPGAVNTVRSIQRRGNLDRRTVRRKEPSSGTR